jgi:uncharacterized protein
VRPAVRLWAARGLAVLLLLAAGGAAAAEVPPRPGERPILDLARVLSPEQTARLDARLGDLYRTTGVTVGVLTVDSIAPETIDGYAERVFREWRLGEAGRDDGVLLVLAVRDRRVRIETGYGIEGVLPDGRTGELLDRHALPAFRQGRFGDGILAVTDAVAAVLEREAPRGAPRPAPPARGQKGPGLGWLLFLLVLAVALSMMVSGGGGRRGIGPGRRRHYGGPIIIPGGFGGFGGGSSGGGWGGFGGRSGGGGASRGW